MFKFLNSIKSYVLKNPETTSILLALIVAFCLRAYKINSCFGFFGDQGRDLLIIHDWFKSGIIPTLGPSASVGGFHLGPLYYYMQAPFIWIFQGNPLAPVIMNLLIGVLLIWFIYKLMLLFADFKTALFTSLIVTFSSYTIFTSRGSWNPHPQSLVVILLIYLFLKFKSTDKLIYLFLTFLALGAGIQLHYTFGANIISILLLILIFKKKTYLNVKALGLMALGFLLPLTPYIVGQFQTNLQDVHLLVRYIRSPKSGQISLIRGIYDRIYYPLSNYYPLDIIPWSGRLLAKLLFVGIVFTSVVIALKKSKFKLLTTVCLVFVFTNLITSTFMKVDFYPHYYLSFSIIYLLLIGIIISYLFQQSKMRLIGISVFMVFIVWGAWGIPSLYKFSRTPQDVYQIADIILSDYKHAGINEPLSISVYSPATLTEGFEYRYMLENQGVNTSHSEGLVDNNYIVIERDNDQNVEYFANELSNQATLKQVNLLHFSDSTLIKYAGIYKVGKLKAANN